MAADYEASEDRRTPRFPPQDRGDPTTNLPGTLSTRNEPKVDQEDAPFGLRRIPSRSSWRSFQPPSLGVSRSAITASGSFESVGGWGGHVPPRVEPIWAIQFKDRPRLVLQGIYDALVSTRSRASCFVPTASIEAVFDFDSHPVRPRLRALRSCIAVESKRSRADWICSRSSEPTPKGRRPG
jgi:hypothetical protein